MHHEDVAFQPTSNELYPSYDKSGELTATKRRDHVRAVADLFSCPTPAARTA